MTLRSATVRFLGSGDAFGDGGRLQTCILVEFAGSRVLLDCGASSLAAMKRFGVEPGDIDAVAVSHYHADHFGGLAFLILDGQFNRRAKPLAIYGPNHVGAFVRASMEVAFPGSSDADRPFEVTFHRLVPGEAIDLAGARLRAGAAEHTPGSHAVSLRLETPSATIAYTGDTAWTEGLTELAAGADLLVSEAYTWRKRIPYHLDYQTFAEHRSALDARGFVLTHLGPEMLAHAGEAAELIAYDGLTLAV